MVGHVLAKDEARVRFSLAAQNNFAPIVQWIGHRIPDPVIGVRLFLGAQKFLINLRARQDLNPEQSIRSRS